MVLEQCCCRMAHICFPANMEIAKDICEITGFLIYAVNGEGAFYIWGIE